MITVIFGTRPEAIKLGPVVAALPKPIRLLCTNQHTTLLAGTPAETDLAHAVPLGIPDLADLREWNRTAVPRIAAALEDTELVVVQGDTKSALAGAEAAQLRGIPVAHVEAGVRSGNYDHPWPEEGYRRAISAIATWHCAPTETCREHLLAENVPEARIFLTGNPIVSAIARYSDVRPVRIPEMTVLFTMHRREWLRSGIYGVLDGLRKSAIRYRELTIRWPVHPSVHLPNAWIRSLPYNIVLDPPLPYARTIYLVANSFGVVTDSGGLVEECATLGTPCAVTRYVTDRPEALEAGVARLCEPTAEGVIAAFEALRDRSILRQPTTCYGTADAARRIAEVLIAKSGPPQDRNNLSGVCHEISVAVQ